MRSTSGAAFALRYCLECDDVWRTRRLRLELTSGGRQTLELQADDDGGWRTSEGNVRAEFAGCIDVDLSATAFTNTLPIRRLNLEPGEGQTIAVVYVDVPELTCDRSEQRYTCLEREVDRALYRYERLKDGQAAYVSELEVELDPFLLTPGFMRLWRLR